MGVGPTSLVNGVVGREVYTAVGAIAVMREACDINVTSVNQRRPSLMEQLPLWRTLLDLSGII